jgi:signal transduction histidine kinase
MLPETIELSIFRIVQEGLSNVRRHSNASAVSVLLKHTSPRTLPYPSGFNCRQRQRHHAGF